MREAQIPNLSEDQWRVIAHEALMSEALKHRHASIPEKTEKPKWLLFMESPAGAVLIAGLLSGIITLIVQQYLKDREFKQITAKTLSEMALANAKEDQVKKMDVVREAFELIGRCVTVSDNLIDSTSSVFDPKNFENSVSVTNQRLTMQKDYNKCVDEWRASQEKLTLLMMHYYPGQSDVAQTWQTAQDSTTAYMECASRWFHQNRGTPTNTESACKAERDVYTTSMKQLIENLGRATGTYSPSGGIKDVTNQSGFRPERIRVPHQF